MKEDPRLNCGGLSSSRKHSKHTPVSRLKTSRISEPNTPIFPDLPDDIVDEMLAELREEENVAHE
ncbi:hypothetical protein [Pelagicoccus mobilis]|uniref:Uncharacterized protein n=1 Tax=Pelagicoccus mobilis TaxID=415221 RepID=A0A934RXZ9_9BACT|nr:hypothetical protein [Pelagicoccus mobilis]MBK1877545.1 hypothetical protein [Pelagicoccus mobilis]